MNDFKLPLIYKFQCKRGNSFEERKIELSETLIRYFNPSILFIIKKQMRKDLKLK